MATTQVATKEGYIITVDHLDGASEGDILNYAFDQYQIDPSIAVNPEPEPEPELDIPELGKEMGKAGVRGFGGGLLSSASGLAELADIGTDFIGLEDLIDSGNENEVIRLANEGKQALNEYVGVGDEYKDNYLVNLSEAFGSIASVFVPAGAAGVIGRGASIATGMGMGVGLNAADQADRVKAARERGETVSEGQEDAAIALSGLFGMAEAFTPLQILKKIKRFKNPQKNEEAFNAIRNALESGLGEGLQEVFQTFINNAIEDGVYAEEGVNYGESLWDDFTVGAGAGALLDAVTTGVYRRRSRATRDAEIDRERQFREEDAAASEEYYDRADRAKKAAEMGERLGADLDLQQQQALVESESVSFDPLQPYEGSAVSLKDRGAEYARQLARGAIQQAEGFPDSGKFEVIEELDAAGLGQELDVVEIGDTVQAYDATGKPYQAEVVGVGGTDRTAAGNAVGVAKVLRKENGESVLLEEGAVVTSVNAQQKVEGGSTFKVIHSVSGAQFGEASPYRESAIHLMANLNQEMIDRKVNRGVLDALDIAPESYSPEQAESLYSIGQKLNRPKRFTVTSAVLNEAGGTTSSPNSAYQEDKSIDQLHVNQYGIPPFSQGGGKPKLYNDLSDLTVSQEINLERRKNGQREVEEFTLEEAKQALGDKYPKLFDVLLGVKAPDMPAITEKFGTVGARLAQERIGVEEINTVLAEKNISSSVSSPEMQYIFEKIVNESSVSNMTPAQRVYLVQELKKFPIVGDVGARPSSLPDFRPKSYTKAQYDSAIEHVTETGDGTLENIESNIGGDASVKRTSTIAAGLHRDLKKAGLIDKDDMVSARPLLSYQEEVAENQPYKEDVSELAKALEESLSKDLSGLGLDDIRLRVLDELKVGPVTRKGEIILRGTPEENFPEAEGYFLPSAKTVFLALDTIETNSKDQTPEAKREALLDILNHEIVHGVRFLDLWTAKEWSLLENLAKKKIVPGTGNVTFYNKAQSLYSGKDAVTQMEEAVAELIRYGHKDKRLITGKPRSLVERMYNFFEKAGSSLRGTGFQSFSDVMNRLESGELGSRGRGEIRTLKATEKRMGAVPERGIGLGRNVRLSGPQTPEEEIQSSGIMLSRKRASSPEGMTNIDLMPTEQELGQMKNGTYKPEKKRNLVDAAQFLQDRWEAATGRTEPFEYTPENKEIISDMLAQEALVALDKDANAIGWYDRKIKAAKRVMSLVEPRIMASPESEARFDFGLAVTSNGQAVVDNFEMATKIFRYHEKNGRFPETKKEFYQGGERNAAMLAAFRFHNAYQRSGQNKPIREFLDEDYTVSELSKFALDFNSQVGFEAIKVPSSEGADVLVKASYVLGPKIGQGFYQNIRGNYDPLTMDIWWMRMWNRAVGRPFKSVLGDEVRNNRRNEIKNFMKKSSGLPRKLADEVLKGNDQTRLEIYADPELFDGFIVDLNKRYQKYYKQYKEDKGVNHVKPQIFQKTGTYVKNMAPLLQGTPKGVEERAYMREVVELARDRLKESNYDITTADFQALMWYPEKQLFRSLGVAPGRGSDNDYLDAAEALAKKEGVSRGKIEEALRDADRSRANNDQPSSRGQDGSVRGDVSGAVGQKGSPFVEPRAGYLKPEIFESRIREAEESAAEFAERNPANTILGSLDRGAQVQKDLVDQETMGEPFEFQTKGYRFGRKFVYWVADKFVGLKGAEKDINDYRRNLGLNPLKATESAYIGEESISGILGDKMREFEFKKKKPLAKKIAESSMSLDEIDEFLIMRHAIERNERIASRDETRDVETEPGSGMLRTGEKLSNSFVKKTMKERYDMDWNDAKETWSGGNLKATKLNDIAKDLDQIIDETLDATVEGGLIEPKVAENIRGLYNYYAPMRGKDIEDDYAESIVVGSGLSTKGKEFMRSMGRESAAKSPLGHILLNAERAMSRGTKNKQFGQRLVNLVKNNPDETFWRVISPEDPKYSRAFEKKFTYIGPDKELQGQTFTNVPEGSNSRDYIQKIVIKKDNPFLLDKDLLGVKVDGKQVYIEIADKRLLNAIAGMDGGTVDNLIQKFGLINRWLSMMNTALNPEFIIGNFTKDIQTAIFNILGEQDMSYGKAKDQALIAAVLKDVVPSMGVFYKAMQRFNPKDGTFVGSITGIGAKDAADVREFLLSGAKADWFHSRPPEDQVKTIQSMIDMANGGFKGNFKKGFEAVRSFVEDSNSAVENAVRLATFKASRDQLMNSGISRQEAVAQAASLAKNLTINFNRKGMAGDLINSMYLFFNASVQGTANFGRGLVGPRGNPFSSEASRVKQGAVAALIGFGALSALRAEEESEENPETGRSFYSEIPDYVKERNIVVMNAPSVVPGKRSSNIYIGKDGKEYKGTQFYTTIPLPYGYNVFHVLGQNLFEMTNDHISPLKAASNVTSAFLGSFSPVPVSSLLPTVFTPLREIDKNENFFGGPIYRENFPTGTQLPESQMSMASTKAPFIGTAKAINKFFGGNEQESGDVDISPDVLEHLAEFALGGAGQFYLRSGNALEKWAKEEDLKAREIPFLRKVRGEPDDNLSLSDFYERKKILEQKEARVNFLRGAERVAYRKENANYIKALGHLDRAEERLRELRARRKILRERASRSPADALRSADAEEAVYDRMNSAYNKFNKAYDAIVGRTK